MIVLDDSLVHLAGIFHNMYLKLEESEDDHYLNDDGWKFHIHDVNEVPILAVTTHGTSLYPGQGRDLRLDMKKVHTLWTVNDVTVKVGISMYLNTLWDIYNVSLTVHM